MSIQNDNSARYVIIILKEINQNIFIHLHTDSTSGQVKLSEEVPLSDYEKNLILTNPSIFKNTKPYNPSSGSRRRRILDRSRMMKKNFVI